MSVTKKALPLAIIVGIAVAISLWLFLGRDGIEKNEELIVCSYGGSFQEAQRKAFFEPFERETGIKIREAQWSGEYAKLKAMVKSGDVSWDVVTAAESSIIARGERDGILENIDYSNIDRKRFFPKALTKCSVGFDYYSTVLAFHRQKYPDSKPATWKDFWDTERFPGRRSLRKDPRTTLEFALLADGVAMDKLYPLDVDRAFRSLDRIANSTSVWWTSGHQPAQLLADRQVDMVSAFNGRIWAAETIDKVPLEVSWEGGALDVDAWIIPKGTKKYRLAMRLIEYTCRPEVQLELIKYINYSPTMPEAFEKLNAVQRSVLPTAPENFSKQFVFDGDWWAENEPSVLERWNQWILKR